LAIHKCIITNTYYDYTLISKTIDEVTSLDKHTENTLFWKLIYLNTQEWALEEEEALVEENLVEIFS